MVSTRTPELGEELVVPLQRTRSDCWSVAYTQTALLTDLLVKVLFSKGIEFLAVLLFDGTSFTIEGLHIVEPCDATQNPSIHGFEAVLYNHVSPLLVQHDPTDRHPTNLQLGAELRRDVYLGHAELTR